MIHRPAPRIGDVPAVLRAETEPRDQESLGARTGGQGEASLDAYLASGLNRDDAIPDPIAREFEAALVQLPVRADDVRVDGTQLLARAQGTIAVPSRPSHAGRRDLADHGPIPLGADAEAELQARDRMAVRVDHMDPERPGRHEGKLRRVPGGVMVQVAHPPHAQPAVPRGHLLEPIAVGEGKSPYHPGR